MLDIVGIITVRRRDRGVLPDDPVSAQDLVDDVLAVHAMFQGHPDIVVVEGRHVRAHGQGVVQRARGLDQIDGRVLPQEVCRLGVDAVDDIDLTRHDGVLA